MSARATVIRHVVAALLGCGIDSTTLVHGCMQRRSDAGLSWGGALALRCESYRFGKCQI